MTDLLDRLSNKAESLGLVYLPPLLFLSSLELYALGKITAGQIVADHNLTPEEIAQANQLRVVLDAKISTGPVEKHDYLTNLRAVFFRLSDPNESIFHDAAGGIKKATVKQFLEI